jgi:hypothetical protein
MRGLLDLLAKARLIELSDDERTHIDEPAATTEQTAEMPPPAAEISIPPPAPTETEIEEGKPLEDIFALAAIAPAAFPAERLLRLLDGLRAMDAGTRKTAVLAMDAADDSWRMDDPVTDAQRKMAALESYKQRLAAQIQGAEHNATGMIGDIRAGLETTTAEIRRQIAELEQLLEREVTKAAQQTTALEGGLRATREAAARELRRMDKEIERLREIPATFLQADPDH